MPKFTDENWEDVPSLLTTAEVAALLRVHPNTVKNMLSKGTLPSILIGERKRRIKKADLLRFIGEEVDEEETGDDKAGP